MPCCKHKVLTTFYRKGTYHNTAAKLQALSDNQFEEFKAFINVLYDKLQNSFSLLSHRHHVMLSQFTGVIMKQLATK